MADDINLPNLVSHLQVNLADTNGIVADAARQGSSVGAALGDSMRDRVEAAIRDIPEVELDDNSSELDRDLARVRRELQELAATRIGVDISVEEALRRMEELEPHLDRLEHSHPNVNVQAAIGGARADLQEILELARRVDGDDVTIDVHTDTARASNGLRDVERGTANVTAALRGIGPALGSLGSIGAIAGSAIPAVAGLVATLEQIAPAAAVGATAAAAIGSAIGAVKLGTSGVGDAIKAAFAPATGGGGAGAAAAGTNAVADAQRNLKDAIEAAALANQQAARQVISSERDLRDAERAELDAQKALVEARKDAARQLQDLNDSLVDARLGERDAVLSVQEAEAQLTKDKAAGSKVSADQLARDQLAYDKAVQALAEQREQVKRLEEDTTAANAAGVNGSKEVQDAQQAVADTAQDVSDKQQAVADAQANVQRTAEQGAEAIDKAREALAQAGAAGGAAAGGVDKFAAAMAKLSPAAQEFVREIIKLKPEFDKLKLDVQQHLFAGLADELDRLASALLPDVRRSLDQSATSLNLMAKGAGDAAIKLGKDGTLGKALDGANKGLANLIPIPGQVVTALGQLADAAAPAFDRLTKTAADKVGDLSARLDKAFKSGALEQAIDDAVDALDRLLKVGGNVAKIIDHILAPANAQGGGLIGLLQQITGELAKLTGEKGFQDALGDLFEVINRIGQVAGPLLVKALHDIEPIFDDLKGPADDLVDALGKALSPILDALAPLLDSAAKGVGALVEALLPLLPVASKIIASLGPDLQPILDDLTRIFSEDLAPAVQQVADSLSITLQPILDDLPQLIGPLADLVARNLVLALKALSKILQDNGPELSQLGIDLANLAVALGPLVGAFTQFSTTLLIKAAPAIIAVLDAATRFGTYMSTTFSGVINDIVIPAVQILTDLLNGRFADAWKLLRQHAEDAVGAALRAITGLPGAAAAALAPLAGKLGSKAVDGANHLFAPIQHGVDSAVVYIGGLPGRIKSELGNLGNLLYQTGKSLISGLMHGITDSLPDLGDLLGGVTHLIKSKKGPPELDRVLLTPAGESIMQGLMRGIAGQLPALRAQLAGITAEIGGMPALAGALPSSGALVSSYAGTRAPQQGPTTINLFGTEATPEGVSAALSWRSKVGRQ
jgi:hypothetical protein